MKYLWLYYLPLLYLPSGDYAIPTAFGTLQLSDLLVGPYLCLLLVALYTIWIEERGRILPEKLPKRRYISVIQLLMQMWFYWAILSTLTIIFRYPSYADLFPSYFALLKLAKISLYAVVAVLTIKVLSKLRLNQLYMYLWAFLASSLMLGVATLATHYSLTFLFPWVGVDQEPYQENGATALMGIQIVFLAGMLFGGHGTRRWRTCAGLGLVAVALGLVLTEGRGGWVATILGLLYISLRLQIKLLLRLVVTIVVFVAIAYTQIPEFRNLINITLFPDYDRLQLLEYYEAGVFGIDTIDAGARPRYWVVEGTKIINAPLLGTGFFHRGGATLLDPDGSHNFFLQMFLETGIVGGILIVAIFRQMWIHASSEVTKSTGFELPVKASLIVALVSGMTGEYFYGGTVLFTLLLAYAPVGRLELEPSTLYNRHRLLHKKSSL